MNNTNPLYVPRNYLAQLAIDDAEQGDFAKIEEWMQVLEQPYTWQEGMEPYAQKRPEWARRPHRVFTAVLQFLRDYWSNGG